MHKNNFLPSCENQVWPSGKRPAVEAIPVAQSMQSAPNAHLRLRIAACDEAHPFRPFARRQWIDSAHTDIFSADPPSDAILTTDPLSTWSPPCPFWPSLSDGPAGSRLRPAANETDQCECSSISPRTIVQPLCSKQFRTLPAECVLTRRADRCPGFAVANFGGWARNSGVLTSTAPEGSVLLRHE